MDIPRFGTYQNGTIQAPHNRRKMLRLKAKTKRLYLNDLNEATAESCGILQLVALASELVPWSWSFEMATAAMRSCGHPDVCPSDFAVPQEFDKFDTFQKWQWPQDISRPSGPHSGSLAQDLHNSCTNHGKS